MSAQEQMGTLSRDERALASTLTAADMLAWLEAHKATITIGMHTEIRWDGQRGAWTVARNSDDGIDMLYRRDSSTAREALAGLIEHETGRTLKAGWL